MTTAVSMTQAEIKKVRENQITFFEGMDIHAPEYEGVWISAGLRMPVNRPELFVRNVSIIHRGIYDYSKMNYVNVTTPIVIIHADGEFKVTPKNHLAGVGHKSPTRKSSGNAKSTAKFIADARAIHGDYFDYSKVVYTNNHTPVTIIHPEDGPCAVLPKKHLQKTRAPAVKPTATHITNLQSFVTRANKLYNNYYDYQFAVFVDLQTPVIVVDPIHGRFDVSPQDHIQGKCHPESKQLKPFASDYYKSDNYRPLK